MWQTPRVLRDQTHLVELVGKYKTTDAAHSLLNAWQVRDTHQVLSYIVLACQESLRALSLHCDVSLFEHRKVQSVSTRAFLTIV